MLRWLATFAIAALLVLNLVVPGTSIGRRAAEGAVRNEAPNGVAQLGSRLPDFTLLDRSGEPFRLADLRGHRVLLTFERSLDW